VFDSSLLVWECCEIGVDLTVGAIQLVYGREVMELYDALTIVRVDEDNSCRYDSLRSEA
jgi:hypothetical protein